jgi:cyclopropane fatty-acyl-phospholipid synthase-like methyltransferase
VYESIFPYTPTERYDAVVLCGVMGHLPDYPRLFEKFDALLEPGVAPLHGLRGREKEVRRERLRYR